MLELFDPLFLSLLRNPLAPLVHLLVILFYLVVGLLLLTIRVLVRATTIGVDQREGFDFPGVDKSMLQGHLSNLHLLLLEASQFVIE